MKSSFLLLLCAVLLVPTATYADEINVAIAFDGSAGRQYISMSPNGGLGASKAGDISNREIFVMHNMTGDKIETGAQVKFRIRDTIWARSGEIINRISARGSKDDLTVFDLKEVNGFYRLGVPGGGWLGGVSENRKSFSIVQNEEDGIFVEFVVNPQGDAAGAETKK